MLRWTRPLSNRKKTNFIVVHHTGVTADQSLQAIHAFHKGLGWAGIGYHFLIRKDGVVYDGRPVHTIGAHVRGYNSRSIGIALTGNFETQEPTSAQLETLRVLLNSMKRRYPGATIVGHRDLTTTLCPGRNLMAWLKMPDVPDGRAEFESKITQRIEGATGFLLPILLILLFLLLKGRDKEPQPAI